jgi:hypothetical protein
MNILEQYKASLKSVDVEEVVELFFFRPLAFLLVKSIYNTNLTPNQLTLAGLALQVVLFLQADAPDLCFGPLFYS